MKTRVKSHIRKRKGKRTIVKAHMRKVKRNFGNTPIKGKPSKEEFWHMTERTAKRPRLTKDWAFDKMLKESGIKRL